MNSTYCFTDASYNPQHKIACIGYLVYRDLNHNSYDLTKEPIVYTEILEIDGVANAEKLATQKCMNSCRQIGIKDKLIIYTDHEGSLKKESEWRQLYGEIELRLLKGHQKSATKAEMDLIFTKIDRLTRKMLRQHIKSL